MSSLAWSRATVSQALAQANPNASMVLGASKKKTSIRVGSYYKIVWNNVIEECRVEKLVDDGEGNSTVYFSLANEKFLGERKVGAYSGEAFKHILLSGGEDVIEL